MTMQQIRKRAKMTQNDTSKITGLTIKYISDIENGRRNPSDKSKRKLARAYKVPVVEIFLACQRTKCSK
jgi:transcriptional regulator with XRE-family HTH domain